MIVVSLGGRRVMWFQNVHCALIIHIEYSLDSNLKTLMFQSCIDRTTQRSSERVGVDMTVGRVRLPSMEEINGLLVLTREYSLDKNRKLWCSTYPSIEQHVVAAFQSLASSVSDEETFELVVIHPSLSGAGCEARLENAEWEYNESSCSPI